jgi:tetratricopeptide (TPR) repeat protein
VTTRAAAIAEHLQRAGRDAEAAGWWWRAAGRARDLYAHAEEYAYLRRAEALGSPPAEVAVGLGDVLTVLGRYREALAEFESAASALDGQPPGSAAGDGPQAGAAAVEHKLAEVHHRLGDWALAEAHLEVALELLGPGHPSRRARIEADRALLAYRRGAAQAAAGLAERALHAAREATRPPWPRR